MSQSTHTTSEGQCVPDDHRSPRSRIFAPLLVAIIGAAAYIIQRTNWDYQSPIRRMLNASIMLTPLAAVLCAVVAAACQSIRRAMGKKRPTDTWFMEELSPRIVAVLAMLAYAITDVSAYRAVELPIMTRMTVIILASLFASEQWRRGAYLTAAAVVAFWSCQLAYLLIEHGPVRGMVCTWPSHFGESIRAWKELFGLR